MEPPPKKRRPGRPIKPGGYKKKRNIKNPIVALGGSGIETKGRGRPFGSKNNNNYTTPTPNNNNVVPPTNINNNTYGSKVGFRLPYHMREKRRTWSRWRSDEEDDDEENNNNTDVAFLKLNDRLLETEKKLAVILCWIKNQHGEDHEIIQLVKASLGQPLEEPLIANVGKTSKSRNSRPIFAPASETIEYPRHVWIPRDEASSAISTSDYNTTFELARPPSAKPSSTPNHMLSSQKLQVIKTNTGGATYPSSTNPNPATSTSAGGGGNKGKGALALLEAALGGSDDENGPPHSKQRKQSLGTRIGISATTPTNDYEDASRYPPMIPYLTPPEISAPPPAPVPQPRSTFAALYSSDSDDEELINAPPINPLQLPGEGDGIERVEIMLPAGIDQGVGQEMEDVCSFQILSTTSIPPSEFISNDEPILESLLHQTKAPGLSKTATPKRSPAKKLASAAPTPKTPTSANTVAGIMGIDDYNCSDCNKRFISIRQLAKHSETHNTSSTSQVNGETSKNSTPISTPTATNSNTKKINLTSNELKLIKAAKQNEKSTVSARRPIIELNSKSISSRIKPSELKATHRPSSKHHHNQHSVKKPSGPHKDPRINSILQKSRNVAKKKIRAPSGSEGPIECELCSKVLNGRNSYNYHKIISHSTKKTIFICSKCKKCFSSHDALNEHTKIAHGGDPGSKKILGNEVQHTCKSCKKNFSGPEALYNHRKLMHSQHSTSTSSPSGTGTGAKTRNSSTSSPSAAHNNSLRTRNSTSNSSSSSEQRSSLSSKPKEGGHKCEYCGKSYVIKEDLDTHRASIHLDKSNPTKCKICRQVLSTAYALKRHVELVHGDKVGGHISRSSASPAKSQ